MYERSAIVLERYMDKILEFNKQYNLKNNYNNYKELIEEIENYQIINEKESKIIQEFDETVKKIEDIQKEQEKLYKVNLKLEENRNKLFYDLDEDVPFLESRFQKIETNLDKDNEQLKKLRDEFIKYLSDFAQRQKERNKCEKARRLGEANHIEYIEKVTNEYNLIDDNDVLILKKFISSEKDEYKQEIHDIMIKNGKNEKVGFNKEILEIAIRTRMDIAIKETECYILIYEKMKKLLSEIDNDNLKLDKYKKVLRDTSVKLTFLNAEKEYIVGLLDYERMTAISGVSVHKKMMEDACKNFELDVAQIDNLYELILKEISNKSSKKAYKELYNKTYLKNIEDKEKNFEKEVNNIKINMGTVINSNYWRIDGVKNVYNVFQNEVSEKFEKDLSEFRIEDVEEDETQESLKEKVEEPEEELKEKVKLKVSRKVKKEETNNKKIKENQKNVNKSNSVDEIDLNEDGFDDDNYEDNINSKELEEIDEYDEISDDYEDDFFDNEEDDDENDFLDEEDEDDEDDLFDDEEEADEDDLFDDEEEADEDDLFDDEEEDDEDDLFDDEEDDEDDLFDDEEDDEDDLFDEEEEDDEDDLFDDEEDDEDDLFDEEEEDDKDDYEENDLDVKNKKKNLVKRKTSKCKKDTKSRNTTKRVSNKQESKILNKIFKDKKAKTKKNK